MRRQTLTMLVTWLCLSNRKAERTWSHSLLLADFAGTTCCSQFGVSESTIFVDAPNTSTESFLLHSVMMEPKMLPLNLSCMDLPRIRVQLLLFYRIRHCKITHWNKTICVRLSSGKQSQLIKIVDVCRRSQPPRLSLNSRSTCFGSISIVCV